MRHRTQAEIDITIQMAGWGYILTFGVRWRHLNRFAHSDL